MLKYSVSSNSTCRQPCNVVFLPVSVWFTVFVFFQVSRFSSFISSHYYFRICMATHVCWSFENFSPSLAHCIQRLADIITKYQSVSSYLANSMACAFCIISSDAFFISYSIFYSILYFVLWLLPCRLRYLGHLGGAFLNRIFRWSPKWGKRFHGSLSSWPLSEQFISLWPCDTIWRHQSWSTLAQVMVCCLTAPSHYLNQC